MNERQGFEAGGRGLKNAYLEGFAAIVVALLLAWAASLGLLRPGRGVILLICVWSAIRANQLRDRWRDRRGARNVWETPLRREQEVWADPPVAKLDKSIIGRLLANRLRRDPRIQVVVARPEADSAPQSRIMNSGTAS